MGVRLPGKQMIQSLTKSSWNVASDVPKGHFAVYVGQNQLKRFVVPVSLLKNPSFQNLLRKAEEEFGYNPPMGGLTIPCTEDTLMMLTSGLGRRL